MNCTLLHRAVSYHCVHQGRNQHVVPAAAPSLQYHNDSTKCCFQTSLGGLQLSCLQLYVIDAAGSLSMKATVQLRHVATKLTVRYTLSPSMHRVAGHVVDLRFLLGGNSVVIGQV